jgi:hypothetical protein
VTEEAIWCVSNMSMLSSMYEEDFSYAASAMLTILRSDKIDNLSSRLNL